MTADAGGAAGGGAAGGLAGGGLAGGGLAGGAAGGALRGGEPVGVLVGHTGPVVCLAAAEEAAEGAGGLLSLLPSPYPLLSLLPPPLPLPLPPTLVLTLPLPLTLTLPLTRWAARAAPAPRRSSLGTCALQRRCR